MMQAIKDFHTSYSWKNLSVLFFAAFLLRAFVFYGFLQHEERYWQSDSTDYHNCALSLYARGDMVRIDNGAPIFWRTPGYPYFLNFFYKSYGVKGVKLSENEHAIKPAMFWQIVLTSFIPILVFFLVLLLTNVMAIAWGSAWITAVHLGFVLASGYVLTDALAVLFFLIFYIFFYKGYYVYGEQKSTDKTRYKNLILAALSLAAFTWMKPFGQWVAIIAAFLLVIDNTFIQTKAKQILLFLIVFWSCLAPWYIRNHNATGHWFFWPGSGSYLLSFNVPKILRRLSGKPIEECHKYVMRQASARLGQEKQRLLKESPHLYASQELVCAELAWPIVKQYPWYVAIDWIKEVLKTTFDLYASQLVDFARNSFKWDPMEEFLTEKVADCLYREKMPIAMRLLCWLEFLFALLKWLGLFGGLWLFFIKPLTKKLHVSAEKKQLFYLWLKTGLMAGALLGMTGGFGYARLRLPVDPLLYMLSLTWWYWLYKKKKAI